MKIDGRSYKYNNITERQTDKSGQIRIIIPFISNDMAALCNTESQPTHIIQGKAEDVNCCCMDSCSTRVMR